MDLTPSARHFFVTRREAGEAVSDAASAIPSRPRPLSVV